MSWILFLCLAAYGSTRIVLGLRGQWRFMRLRRGLPAWPVRPVAPRCLGAGLAGLLGRNFDERVRLVESTRTIATVLIVDPDAPLGWIRDFRYRLAVAAAWSAASAWLASFEALGEDDRGRLERLGYSAAPFRERHAWLYGRVRTTVRARALEPFEVSAVEATRAMIDAMIEDLALLERALCGGVVDPYRS